MVFGNTCGLTVYIYQLSLHVWSLRIHVLIDFTACVAFNSLQYVKLTILCCNLISQDFGAGCAVKRFYLFLMQYLWVRPRYLFEYILFYNQIYHFKALIYGTTCSLILGPLCPIVINFWVSFREQRLGLDTYDCAI